MKKILVLILGLILFTVNQPRAADVVADGIEVVCIVDQDQPQTQEYYVSQEAYEVYVEKYTSTLIYKAENVPIMVIANYDIDKSNLSGAKQTTKTYLINRGEPSANRGKFLAS